MTRQSTGQAQQRARMTLKRKRAARTRRYLQVLDDHGRGPIAAQRRAQWLKDAASK